MGQILNINYLEFMNNPNPYLILILVLVVTFLITLFLLHKPEDPTGWIHDDVQQERLTPDGVVFKRQ